MSRRSNLRAIWQLNGMGLVYLQHRSIELMLVFTAYIVSWLPLHDPGPPLLQKLNLVNDRDSLLFFSELVGCVFHQLIELLFVKTVDDKLTKMSVYRDILQD